MIKELKENNSNRKMIPTFSSSFRQIVKIDSVILLVEI